MDKNKLKVHSQWKNFRVVENSDGDYAIIDTDGNIVVPWHGYIDDLVDGVAMASMNGWEISYWILLGEDGTVFSPNQYIIDGDFDERDGVARAYVCKCNKRKYGIVNLKGDVVTPFEYDKHDLVHSLQA